MKKRIIKKVERRLIVDKICELQERIDEYDRFLGDLLIMLTKRKPQVVIKHYAGCFADMIWDEAANLIKENEELQKK